MAGVSENVIEEIKARTDLADLIASYGIEIRRSGSSAKACCPFHNEKTPSFNINTTRGFYHCFGCGESGDAIKFVQKREGLTFMEAVRKLAEPLGIKVEEAKADPEASLRKRLYALMAELAQFYHRCLLKMKEADKAREYLKSRALDGEVCEDWLIGYAPTGVKTVMTWAEKYGYSMDELVAAGVVKAPDRSGDAGYHRFGGRLMFSVRDRQGRVVAFSGRQLVEDKRSGKYVNSPETPIFKKSNVLFGFDKAAANIAKSPHREAIACEGQIDTIRLHASGFPVAVASQGTAFTEEHARMLKRVCDSIVLAYDDDGAGHKATVKVGGMMLALEVPVRVVSIPDGDDPDSFLRRKGPEEFQKLIDGSVSIVNFQVRSERAKERDPKSIDAVSRVSKAVLETIAKCPSAILKASMLDEAADLLGLPVMALKEELDKVRLSPASKRVAVENRPEEDGDGLSDVEVGAIAGEDAGAVAPPPEIELQLMSFLMTRERDSALDGMIGELLPKMVFSSDFTWRFIEAWRASAVTGEDELGKLFATLSELERSWLDIVMEGGGIGGSSDRTAIETMQDYICKMWVAELSRRRGLLPANGDAASRVEGIAMSFDQRKISLDEWQIARETIHKYIKKGEKWT